MEQGEKYNEQSSDFSENILYVGNLNQSVLNSVGLVPSWISCYDIIDPSWVQMFFTWVFRGSKIFLVGILWLRYFLGSFFVGPKFFSRGCFVGISLIYK